MKNKNIKEESKRQLETDEKTEKNLTLRLFEEVEDLGLWILEKIHLRKLANLYRNYIEGMRYLICGGLSTVVNIVSYILGSYLIFVGIGNEQLKVTISDNFAFIVALIFAYWVNKTIVFDTKCENFKLLLKEIISFTSARVITQLISLGMMNFAVIINMNDVIMKIIANIVVIILNYIFSKLIIFKKKNDNSK